MIAPMLLGRCLVWAWVARAAAQAMSQWLTGLEVLRVSVNIHWCRKRLCGGRRIGGDVVLGARESFFQRRKLVHEGETEVVFF